jgi:Zn-dependent protease
MMFGKRIRLFKLFGFEVRIDWSWIILAILVAWSLSVGFFPFRFRNLSTETYWLMGIVGALGLFFSIIFHEMSHSLVARRYGMPMKGITLFIFGGVAEMGEEPSSAKTELMMALAGPISSIVMALVFYGISLLGRQGEWPQPVIGVIQYLSYINGLLAGFNLIPAFPLDGGRILRSILWGWKSNLRWATRISVSDRIRFWHRTDHPGCLPIFNRKFHRGHVVIPDRDVSPEGSEHVLSTTCHTQSS